MKKQMFAAYYDQPGPASEVLQFGPVDAPPLAYGEVRVFVHACGLNPADVKRLAGSAPSPGEMKKSAASAAEIERSVPGDDGAGVIIEIGEGVPKTRIGQRVWVRNARVDRRYGTMASHVAVPEERAIPLPDGVGFEAGACLGVPAVTAHYALFADGSIEGQTVLIHGGAGGVGSTAVQLAKWGGAKVIATVSGPEKAEIAIKCGADYVINYRDENVTEAVLAITNGQGVDRAVDVAFGVNLAVNLDVIKTNGCLATYSSDADDSPTIPFWRLLRKNLRVHFLVIYWLTPTYLASAIRDISAALATHALKPVVTQVMPLRSLAAANVMVGALSGIGNIVLVPDTEQT